MTATLFGGLYPTYSISAARARARALNELVEAGLDPRDVLREEKARSEMTVANAHRLYMVAVHEGRAPQIPGSLTPAQTQPERDRLVPESCRRGGAGFPVQGARSGAGADYPPGGRADRAAHTT